MNPPIWFGSVGLRFELFCFLTCHFRDFVNIKHSFLKGLLERFDVQYPKVLSESISENAMYNYSSKKDNFFYLCFANYLLRI